MNSIHERLARLQHATRMAVTRQDAPPSWSPAPAGAPFPLQRSPLGAPATPTRPEVRRVTARVIALPHAPTRAEPAAQSPAGWPWPTPAQPVPQSPGAPGSPWSPGVPTEPAQDVTFLPFHESPPGAEMDWTAGPAADPFGDHAALLEAGLSETPPASPPSAVGVAIEPRPLRAASFMETLALNTPAPDDAPAALTPANLTPAPLTPAAAHPDGAPASHTNEPVHRTTPPEPDQPAPANQTPVVDPAPTQDRPPLSRPVPGSAMRPPAQLVPELAPPPTAARAPVTPPRADQTSVGQTPVGQTPVQQPHVEPSPAMPPVAADVTVPSGPVVEQPVAAPQTVAGVPADPAPTPDQPEAAEVPQRAPAPATDPDRERRELEALLRSGNPDIPVRLPRRPRPTVPRAPAPPPAEEIKVAPPIPAEVSQNILARLNRFAELEAAGETDASVIPYRQLEDWQDHHPERNVPAIDPLPPGDSAAPGATLLRPDPATPTGAAPTGRVKARSREPGRNAAPARTTPSEADEEPERGPTGAARPGPDLSPPTWPAPGSPPPESPLTEPHRANTFPADTFPAGTRGGQRGVPLPTPESRPAPPSTPAATEHRAPALPDDPPAVARPRPQSTAQLPSDPPVTGSIPVAGQVLAAPPGLHPLTDSSALPARSTLASPTPDTRPPVTLDSSDPAHSDSPERSALPGPFASPHQAPALDGVRSTGRPTAPVSALQFHAATRPAPTRDSAPTVEPARLVAGAPDPFADAPTRSAEPAPVRPALRRAAPPVSPRELPVIAESTERPGLPFTTGPVRTAPSGPLDPDHSAPSIARGVNGPSRPAPFTPVGGPLPFPTPAPDRAPRPALIPATGQPHPAEWPGHAVTPEFSRPTPPQNHQPVQRPVISARRPGRPSRAASDLPDLTAGQPGEPLWHGAADASPWTPSGPTSHQPEPLTPATITPETVQPDVFRTEVSRTHVHHSDARHSDAHHPGPDLNPVSVATWASMPQVPEPEQMAPAHPAPGVALRSIASARARPTERPAPDGPAPRRTATSDLAVPGRNAPRPLELPVDDRPASRSVLGGLQRALERDGHGTPLFPQEQAALRGVLGTSVADLRVVRRSEVTPALRAAGADGLTVGQTVFLPPEVSLDRPEGLALAAHEAAHALRARAPLFVPSAARSLAPGASDEEGVALATEQATRTLGSLPGPDRRAAGIPAPWEPLPGWPQEPHWPEPARPAPTPQIPAMASRPASPALPVPTQPTTGTLLWHAAATDRPVAAKPAERPPAEQAVGRRAEPQRPADLDQMAREVYARLREQFGQEWRRLS